MISRDATSPALERAFAGMAGRPGIVFWNGAQILDWYNGLSPR